MTDRRQSGSGLSRRGARWTFGWPSLIAPDAGPDSATWVAGVMTLAGVAASGGSGSFTYLWTSSIAGTFSDATSLTSTWTPTDATLTATNTLTVTDTVTLLTASDTMTACADIVTALGARLHWWHEFSAATVTTSGGFVDQINDRGPSGYHKTSSGSNRPVWNANGGPNNLPYAAISNADYRLTNTAIALADAKRLHFYAVGKATGGASFMADVRDGAGQEVFGTIRGGDNHWHIVNKKSGVAEENLDVTSPTPDASWHVFSQRYLAAGLETRIDNVLTTPQPTGTQAAGAVEAIYFGHFSGTSGTGASVYLHLCAESVTTAEDTMIRDYIRFWTGLG